MNRIIPRLTAAALAAATLSALAAAPAHVSLPAERTADGIHYRTGGVARDEAAAFEHALHEYPLAIELLEKEKGSARDAYTADARVRIATPAGKQVFGAKADGPFMLVRLDPGRYDVSATLGRRTLHRKGIVVAKGKGEVTEFVFPAGTD